MQRGWKAVDCARRAGMPLQSWSAWENDRSRRADDQPTRPTPETCDKIAHGLEVSKMEVMKAAGYELDIFEGAGVSEEDVIRLIGSFGGVPEPLRAAAREAAISIFNSFRDPALSDKHDL